jgi:hypothetical protein
MHRVVHSSCMLGCPWCEVATSAPVPPPGCADTADPAFCCCYCCCCCCPPPLSVPTGQQHLSHPLDVLLLLPVLLHCVAISAGQVDALVGYGPATAAAHWRSSWVAGTPPTHNSSSSSQGPGQDPQDKHLGVNRNDGSSTNSSSSSSSSVGQGIGSGVQPVNLHKLAVRAAAAYMFAASVSGQPVRWSVVVSCVSLLMLGGRQAVEGWYRLHAVLYAGRPAAAAAARLRKQKGI